MINLKYQALANSSVIPVGCVYSTWRGDPALRMFPINSAAFNCINLEPVLYFSRFSMVSYAASGRKSSDEPPILIRKGSVSVGKVEA